MNWHILWAVLGCMATSLFLGCDVADQSAVTAYEPETSASGYNRQLNNIYIPPVFY